MKYIVYSSYLSFLSPTKMKYAIIDANNSYEALKILEHTPFISRQWETIKVSMYSDKLKTQFQQSGKNITENVKEYLKHFPIKNRKEN